ncbi:MAG TPA: ABC transporter substrate-binding protein [Kofleriaceae bacterium]|jgi:peptide/nickel transport system substrate-binding protein
MRRSALLAAAVLLSAISCDRAAGLRQRRDPGALVVAQPSDVEGLDPVLVTDSESIEVGEILFEGLTRWKPGTADVEAGLAQDWRVSPDGLAWTFDLRTGVHFHDGEKLDAAAVVFSFGRVLDAKHPQYLAGEGGSYWRGLLKDVVAVTAIDVDTVEIRVARPYAPLLADLAVFPIVAPAAVEKWGKEFAQHPVGTGPFAFEAWNVGEEVVVKRFDGYWGQRPQLDRIVFRTVDDARQRLVDLESGSVDLAMAILPDEQDFVELHPDLKLYHAHSADVTYLAFNTSHPPFDDLRVRRAFAYAINKEPIVKLAFQGRATPADGPLPEGIMGYRMPATVYGYDPVLARKLLGEAIADGTFDPKRAYVFYAPSTPRPYLPQPEEVARFIQASLAQIGVQTDLRLQPINQHRASVAAGEHDLALFGWIGDTGDPDNFLFVLFSSDTGQNIAQYKDPVTDKLLKDAQASSDDHTRIALYGEVQDRIAAAAPWVPIAHSELVVAGRAELTGVVLSPLGHPVYPLVRRGEEP